MINELRDILIDERALAARDFRANMVRLLTFLISIGSVGLIIIGLIAFAKWVL